MSAGTRDIDPARLLVIWNPHAGSKAGVSTNNDQGESGLRDILTRHGLDADLRATTSAHEAAELARAARDRGLPIVAAAGGDGTVRCVARELIGSETALGILPLGSVMNVARALDIPRDLDAAADVLARGEVAAIDVALANGDPFLEAATIGLHAAVFEQGSRFDRGDLLALARAAWVAVRYRPSRMTIRLDGGRVVRTSALAVFVANGPFAGLGFPVAPDARIADGKLDVRVFERFSRLDLLVHFWHIAAGRRGFEPRVATYRSATVTIDARHALPARADGERLGWTPVDLAIRPQALRVVRGERPSADQQAAGHAP